MSYDDFGSLCNCKVLESQYFKMEATSMLNMYDWKEVNLPLHQGLYLQNDNQDPQINKGIDLSNMTQLT